MQFGIPEGVQNGYQCETQVRLGKDNNTISKDIVSSTKVQPIIDSWDSVTKFETEQTVDIAGLRKYR